MSIIKWVPDSDPMDVEKWFFGEAPMRAMTPAVDVYENEGVVVVEAPIPGFDPEKVNIQVEDGVLMISGESEKRKEVEDKNYYRKEVRTGKFARSVALPVAVDSERAEAEYHNGVLKITVPKMEEKKAKSIKINVKK